MIESLEELDKLELQLKRRLSAIETVIKSLGWELKEKREQFEDMRDFRFQVQQELSDLDKKRYQK